MAKLKRQTIPQQIEDFYPSYTKATELLETLKRLIAEYGDSVYLDSYYMSYDETKYYAFYYLRPETDAEYDARIAQEEQWKAQQQDHEFAQYQRLKAKYESQ